MKLVDTDNFGRDYPDEQFLNPMPNLTEEDAQKIADIINSYNGPYGPRFCNVVPDDYKLQPGFEP